MTWARLDDAILDNPKILRIGPLGFALHVAAITHCARNLTDGYVEFNKAQHLLSMRWSGIPDEDDGAEGRRVFELSAVCGMTSKDGDETLEIAIAALKFEGLWKFVDQPAPGYLLHDYLDYNPTRAQVLADREVKRAAGQAGGKARAKQVLKQNPSSGLAGAQAKSKPVPVPVPLTSSSNEEDVHGAPLKQRHKEVCDLWANHHGWPPGKWPSDRRDDAQLIMVWIRDKGYPLALWREVFARVPQGARFRWLITAPEKGKVCRLEEWAIARKDREYAALKIQETPVDLAAGLMRRIA